MKTQSGFTLIEMVAVIIILAIVSATALPKFANLTSEARHASINGLAGGLKSAAALVKSKWLIAQSGLMDTVYLAGNLQPVSTIISSTTAYNGYPTGTAQGIEAAMETTQGYMSSITGTRIAYWPPGVIQSATCAAIYQSGTVTVTATSHADCQ